MNEHLEAIGIGRDYAKVMIPCEICGGTEFSMLQRHGRIAEPGVYGDVNVVICSACGFKMTNPRYEDRFYQDYYERLYREVAFGAERPSPAYVAQQKTRGAGVLRYAQRFVHAPGRMLDHGCASAATSLPWRDAGWQVKGIDPHRPSVELGRAEFGLDLSVAAGELLPFADAVFDLVLSLGSLEHAYDFGATMREIRRTLVHGGWLLIRWRETEMFGSPLEYYNHNHYRFFSPNTWRLALRRHGFDVIDMSKEKHEGYPNYSYIMARASLAPSDAEMKAMMVSGVRDNLAEVVSSHQAYRIAFRDRCAQFLDLAKGYSGRSAKLIDDLESSPLDWTLMPGDSDWAVGRSCLEAERYIKEFDAGRAG